MPLSRENGRYARAPRLLDISEDAQLVVHHDVMLCRVAAHDILQLKLFVNVDEDVALDRLGRFLSVRPCAAGKPRRRRKG